MNRILIADDHVLMREGLMHLLSSEFEAVTFECANGFSETKQKLLAFHQAEHLCATVIILDLRMPGMNGLESVKSLLLAAHEYPIVVYSEVDSSVTKHTLLQLGVFAVECKSQGVESLLVTLRRALASSGIATRLPQSDLERSQFSLPEVSSDNHNSFSVELTSRQMDMLRALHRGLPNKLIAREYGVALGTVKNHLFILYERLGVRSRSEALHKTRGWFL